LLLSVCLLAGACGSAESRKLHFLAKGEAYRAAGNFDKARVEFRNALQIAPDDAEARYKNGLVAEELHNYREAANFYQGAIEASTDHIAARAHLGRLLLVSGQPDRALDIVQPGLDRHPDTPELLTVRGVARSRRGDTPGGLSDVEHARQLAPAAEDTLAALAGLYNASGRPDDARGVLEDGVRKLPASVDLQASLAAQYLQMGQTAKAEAPLLEIVRLQPQEPAHRIRLARYYDMAGHGDRAEAALRQAMSELPDSTAVRLGLVELTSAHEGPAAAAKELAAMAAARPKDDALQFALARFYEAHQQPDEAAATLRAVMQRNADSAAAMQAKTLLAGLEVRSGRRAEADRLIAEVLAKNPRDNDALVLRGSLELDANNPKAAIADLRSVLRDQPDSVYVLTTLARAHELNGEPALADAALRRALEANPGDANAALQLVALLMHTGKTEEARSIVDGLLKREPANPAVILAAFRVQVAQKDYAAARVSAAAATAAQPSAPLGYYLTGLVAEAQSENAEALKNYSKALDLAPDAEQPLEALVRFLVRTGRASAAHERLAAVMARSPNNAVACSLDGEVLVAAKRAAEAEQAFERAISLAPSRFAPYHGIALLKLGAGDTEGAVAALKRAEAAVTPRDEATLVLAEVYRRLGRNSDAVATYEALLARDPHSDVAANNLAMLLVNTRSDPASLKRAGELAARFDESPVVHYLDTNGWVRLKGGDPGAALPVLQKAVDLDPHAPDYRYHLAMAELALGQTDAARANLEAALKSSDRFEGAPDAKAALAQVTRPAPQ
jgi:tetratricopeptide (TPR) repeat protein